MGIVAKWSHLIVSVPQNNEVAYQLLLANSAKQGKLQGERGEGRGERGEGRGERGEGRGERGEEDNTIF